MSIPVPTYRPGRRFAPMRMIGGIEHKACYGPLHPEGAWVPLYDFYGRSENGHRVAQYRCKRCHCAAPGWERFMLLEQHGWIIEELVVRIGINETHRRTGCAIQSIWRWRTGRQRYIRRESLRKIIPVLREARLNNEWRNQRSIHRGAAMRGEPELPLAPRNEHWRTPDEQAKFQAEWDKRYNAELSLKRKRLRAKRRRQREWARQKRAETVGG